MESLVQNGGRSRGRVGPQDARVGRFHPSVQPQIKTLIGSSLRVAELAESFPGLLFALATEYGTPAQRTGAINGVDDGEPLKEIARGLGLPFWLRKLAPEAFARPIGALPSDPDLARLLSSLVPPTASEAAHWLQRLSIAYRFCDSAFCLWIARQRKFLPGNEEVNRAQTALLAAWAWHSKNGGSLACALIRKPWAETISLKRAATEAQVWLNRVRLAIALSDGIEDTWFEPGEALGYEFLPLRQLHDYLAEAKHMHNCLDQYGDQVRFSRTRVFSIRKEGRRVATVEIGPHEDDLIIPRIEQLRGPRNRRAAPEVWQATFNWLAGQQFRPMIKQPLSTERLRRQKIGRVVWWPYVCAIGENPGDALLRGLMHDIELGINDLDGQPTKSAGEHPAT